MGHKHDTNGVSDDVEITVGDEVITYRDQHCTCGAFSGRIIVGRRSK